MNTEISLGSRNSAQFAVSPITGSSRRDFLNSTVAVASVVARLGFCWSNRGPNRISFVRQQITYLTNLRETLDTGFPECTFWLLSQKVHFLEKVGVPRVVAQIFEQRIGLNPGQSAISLFVGT